MRLIQRFALAATLGALLFPLTAWAGSATLENQSSWDIHYLYLSPSNQASWGPDQLREDQVIASGTRFTLTGVDCGNWDVKLVDEVGDECVLSQVYICGKERWVLTDDELLNCQGYGAQQPTTASITLYNQSSWDFYNVFLSPSNQSSWGSDWLESEILENGEYLHLYNLACGTYDVKIIDEDGDACILGGVGLCGEDQWVVDDNALLSCQWGS